jgi:hypothetical protein
MTKGSDLVVGQQGMTLAECNALMRDSKKGKLPVRTSGAVPLSIVETSLFLLSIDC